MRTVDRDDVHAREHLVEAFPECRAEPALDLRVDGFAVVIMDLQAERLGAARHRLADAPHADDAQPLPPDAVSEHPRWRPAAKMLRLQLLGAFDEATRHGQNERHRHVGGVFGQDARRIGDRNAASSAVLTSM